MFNNRPIEIDHDVSSSQEMAGTRKFSVENYVPKRERAERLLKENIAKLPRWRRRIIETALKGGW